MVVAGWSPEMEGLGARDERRMDPAGFLATFKVVVRELVARSGLGSEATCSQNEPLDDGANTGLTAGGVPGLDDAAQ